MIMEKQKIASILKKIGKPYKKDKRSVWVEVKPDNLRKALETVREVDERISDLSVYDTGGGKLEATYRFFISGAVLNLKTSTSEDRPRLPTCTDLFPGALLIEREQHEMFGIVFSGHPKLDKVLFADSTPETPLRKRPGLPAEKAAKKPAQPADSLEKPKPMKATKAKGFAKEAYKVVPAGKVIAKVPKKAIKTQKIKAKKKDDDEKEKEIDAMMVISNG